MKYITLLAFVMAIIAIATALTPAQLEHYHSMATQINSSNTTWKAGLSSKFAEMDMVAIRNSFGDLSAGGALDVSLPVKTSDGLELSDLPESFSSIEKWQSVCPQIATVPDQSACGSCWAVSVAWSATSRLCIASQGEFQGHLSASDLLSCCSSCGYGCNGGYPPEAWNYIQHTGLVTGHIDFTNHTLCQAYPFLSCHHHTEGEPQCSDYDFHTPKCVQKCDPDTTYPIDFKSDKKKTHDSFYVTGEAAMMKELMTNGPFEVSYQVYDDFMVYKSGIYKRTSNKSLGGHAVSVVGWGVEDGVKYWDIVNNWNTSWGENGHFRIIRGTNECGIEGQGTAGLF